MRSDEGRVHTVVGLGRNLDCDNVRQKDKYLAFVHYQPWWLRL